jgi:hypothetical protein
MKSKAPRFIAVRMLGFGLLRLAQRSRQPHDELGERADAALDIDAAAMPARHDLVADREAEPGALAGRLGREERREELGADRVRYADAVVAHADLDRVAEAARRHLEQRREARLAAVALALVGGIESVAEQIEEHSGQILRHRGDRADCRIEIALHRDVEALILGAQTVIGESLT